MIIEDTFFVDVLFLFLVFFGYIGWCFCNDVNNCKSTKIKEEHNNEEGSIKKDKYYFSRKILSEKAIFYSLTHSSKEGKENIDEAKILKTAQKIFRQRRIEYREWLGYYIYGGPDFDSVCIDTELGIVIVQRRYKCIGSSGGTGNNPSIPLYHPEPEPPFVAKVLSDQQVSEIFCE